MSFKYLLIIFLIYSLAFSKKIKNYLPYVYKTYPDFIVKYRDNIKIKEILLKSKFQVALPVENIEAFMTNKYYRKYFHRTVLVTLTPK